jgi:hypothetical protein
MLRDPIFQSLAGSFLERADGGDEPPVPAVARNLPPLYSRPLSPVLGSDL